MTISKTKEEAIERAKKFVKDGYRYIYGYKEQYNPVSKRWIDILKQQNPGTFTPSYVKKAEKFIGQRAVDCSGLVCEAIGLPLMNSYALGSLIRTNAPDGFEEIKNPEPGCICWKQGHVGIVIDEKHCVEARGIDAGVGVFEISSQPWQRFIRVPYKESVLTYTHVGWHREPSGKWWYAYSIEKGSYYMDCIRVIDGKMYLFNSEGYLLKSKQYLTDESGEVTEMAETLYIS